ncbi:DNA topoisomerase 2-alpha-like [Dermacentor variabilis]|uniref:DNA topoisomerase 2-alpha-like n=1 Tax=Dermacentor variabilis TaxID=34621 RepID=UPI003F5C5488
MSCIHKDRKDEEPPASSAAAEGQGRVQQTKGTDAAEESAPTVEDIYRTMTPVDHILRRPDAYIGSIEPITQTMWVHDKEDKSGEGLRCRSITIVPGLYKIFDEILVNATDNKQRDRNMEKIEIAIKPEEGCISIKNDGQGIPVVKHSTEQVYIPTLIFGRLLTSSHYNDDEKKVTGGRNGYGAKLCNIFSRRFSVATYSSTEQKCFQQVWEDNMHKTTCPEITTATKGRDYTQVTFYPDLAKFGMKTLDVDAVALMSRRAYDVAGCTHGIKVFLNGMEVPVNNFRDYVNLFLKNEKDDMGKALTVAHELVSDRWELAVTLSTSGDFRQMSFVNGIATTKGGTHVDYVMEQLIKKVMEYLKNKNKTGMKIYSKDVKNYFWIFLNCLIENPTFDSQGKEYMTLSVKKFGSECKLSDKFYTQMLRCGIVERVISWMDFKAETQLEKKCLRKKLSRLKGIPKLEDANDAGTKNSCDCTLIVTEGDSAKTLAVSGLSVVGRDKFGIFPLKGKVLNAREATPMQMLKNEELSNLVKIMGLRYKKKYETIEDMKGLRYGRLMIMTDQDPDGSHIKGLIINFIHFNWPSLLKLPFLQEFITPIVKARNRAKAMSFYSLPEFEEWKAATDDWKNWSIKYYKGLGTSSAKEAKEYFADISRHRITFEYQGDEDDAAIELAFSKSKIKERKEWLQRAMEEQKQRREMGLCELYLYSKETKKVTYQDFINKELVLFSKLDNERSIPSLVDGLKPGQRKVLYTCFKRNDKREIKVAQLAGSVAENSAYHHGEESLMTTIINLAQNFVGSNNVNLLMPIGQFGTRLQGGSDAASPRYIFTKMSPLARLIMPTLDDSILQYMYEDNQQIEPKHYIPILPMVLVNGAEGIGTGWSTKIPNYNPRDIIKNLRKMIAGGEPNALKPWFKNFHGSIDQVDEQRFVVSGEVAVLNSTSIEITELPVRVWTERYKQEVLETMLRGTAEAPPIITGYREYHTDTTVRFVVNMTEENLTKARDEGVHKVFKLQRWLTTSSMVLFDSEGILRTFRTADEILREFYVTRMEGYVKRKAYLIGMLSAEAKSLENQARFILEKIDDTIKIENRRRKEIMETLQRCGYDPDPIIVWKRQQLQQAGCWDSQAESEDEIEDSSEAQDEESDKDRGSKRYDYLLGMPLWNLTMEKRDNLLKKRDKKQEELEVLCRKSPEVLWEEDLDALSSKLDELERKEWDDKSSSLKVIEGAKGGHSKAAAPEDTTHQMKLSEIAERIVPKIEWKLNSETTGGHHGPEQAATDANAEDCGDDGDRNAGPAAGQTSPDAQLDRTAASASTKASQRLGSGIKAMSEKRKKRNSTSSSDSSEDKGSPMSFGQDENNYPKPAADSSHQEERQGDSPKRREAPAKSSQPDTAADDDDQGFVKAAAKKPTASSRASKRTTATRQTPAAADDSDTQPNKKKAAKKKRVVLSSSDDDDALL